MAAVDIFGSGVRFPIQPTESGDLELVEGEDALFQGIGLILTTPQQTCPMDPLFGSAVDAYDPLQSAGAMGHEMARAIERVEGRIDRLRVILEEYEPERGIVRVSLEVDVAEVAGTMVRTFPLYTLRDDRGTD